MKDIQFENKKLYSVVEVGKILGMRGAYGRSSNKK